MHLHQTFTSCVSNWCTNLLIFQHARCECKLWIVLCINCFSYEFSHLKSCIVTKDSQTMYVVFDSYSQFDTSKCQKWLRVMESYLISFLFSTNYIFSMLYLHQTFPNCVLRQKCWWKVNLCNHLRLRQFIYIYIFVNLQIKRFCIFFILNLKFSI